MKYIKNLEDKTQSVITESLADDAAELSGLDSEAVDTAVKGLDFAGYLELGNAVETGNEDRVREILNVSDVVPQEPIGDDEIDLEEDVVDFKQAKADKKRQNWEATMQWAQRAGILNPADPLPEYDPDREEKCYICGSTSAYGHTEGCEFAPQNLPPQADVGSIEEENLLDKPTPYEYEETWCSQCGKPQGPGNEGYSHCKDHKLGETDHPEDQNEHQDTLLCSLCGGQGYDRHGNTCTKCGGQGRVTLDGEYIDEDRYEDETDECINCYGRGEDYGETCFNCGGRGRVRKDGGYIDDEWKEKIYTLDQADLEEADHIKGRAPNKSKNYSRMGGNKQQHKWKVTFNNGKSKTVWADSRYNATHGQISPEQHIIGIKSAVKINEADNPSAPVAAPGAPAATPPSAGSSIDALAKPVDTAVDDEEAPQGRKEIEDLMIGDEIEVADIDGQPAAGRVRNLAGPGDTLVITGKGNEEHMIRKDSILSTPLIPVRETYKTYTDKHVALFRQIQKDLGKKEINYKNVEKVLKHIGWQHNSAVKASVDFMDWYQSEMMQENQQSRLDKTNLGKKNKRAERVEDKKTKDVYENDDFWAETAKKDEKVAKFAEAEWSPLGFKRHSNWPAGTTLLANGDLRKQVRAKFKAEGWTKEEPENRLSWWKHPSLPYISVAEYDRGRTTVTSMLPYGAAAEEYEIDTDAMREAYETALSEVAPPGMEGWIKKRKPEFKERYGKDWEEVLYATAWKQKNNESIEESEDRVDHREIIDMISRHVSADDMAEDLLPLIGYAFDDLEIGFDADLANKVLMDMGREPIAENVGDKHQKKIAIDTVKNPSKGLLGGPSAKEAEQTLRDKFGYSDKQIAKLKEGRDIKQKRQLKVGSLVVDDRGQSGEVRAFLDRSYKGTRVAKVRYYGGGNSGPEFFYVTVDQGNRMLEAQQDGINEELSFFVDPIGGGRFNVMSSEGDIHDTYEDGIAARKAAESLNAQYGEIDEDLERIKELAGLNEVKSGKFNSKMIGQRVKITGQPSFDDGNDYRGEEGVITRASREHTFSQMVPFVIEYGVKLDNGKQISIRRERVRKIKPVTEMRQGNETNAEEMRRLKRELRRTQDRNRRDYLRLEIRKLQGEIDLRKERSVTEAANTMYNRKEEWIADAEKQGYQLEQGGDNKIYAHKDGKEYGYWDPNYGGGGTGIFHNLKETASTNNQYKVTFNNGKSRIVKAKSRDDAKFKAARLVDAANVGGNVLISGVKSIKRLKETASGGATGAGAIASSPTAVGGMQSRNQSIYGQTKLKKKPTPKKRPTKESNDKGLGRDKKS